MVDVAKLSGPSMGPASGAKPKQIVILAHGLGADGNDLIGLAPYFARALPDALFVSPNAPQRFDIYFREGEAGLTGVSSPELAGV